MLDGLFALLDCAVAAADPKGNALVRVLGALICVAALVGGIILLYDALA